MSRSRTVFIDLQRLSSCGNDASIIIRLMMACNDLFLANQFLSMCQGAQPPIHKHVQRGAMMYFVRLQCGHLNEAMKIITEIKQDKKLCDEVKKCSRPAQESFTELTSCLSGGANEKKFNQDVGKIRHNTVFHYDERARLIKTALRDRAGRQAARPSKITTGDRINLIRFELADDIIDTIVCRQIWGIPRQSNLREEADRHAKFGSDLCKSFLVFSDEFILRYIEDRAAI
jgi:hypothetical protein